MRAWLSVFVLAIVMSTTIARAQPKPAHPPLARALSGDARVLYDAARELFRAGDYASASAKFQRALELSSDPRLYWNLAACERKAKHNASVLRLIEVYLREGEGWLSDEDKNEATRAAAAVRVFVAAARVTTRPDEGVDVFVDDVRVGTTPIAKPLWIDMGTRRVRFAKAGLKPVERKEEVQAGSDITWVADLEPESVAAPEPPPPAQPERPEVAPAPIVKSPSRLGPILVGGVGLVAAATGGVLAGITVNKFSQLRSDCGTACPRSDWEKYQTMQTAGDVLLIAGGSLVMIATVWWLLQPTAKTSGGMAGASF